MELEAAHKEADAARKAKTQATDHCTADTASAVQAKQQEVDAVKREKEDLQLAMSLKEQASHPSSHSHSSTVVLMLDDIGID